MLVYLIPGVPFRTSSTLQTTVQCLHSQHCLRAFHDLPLDRHLFSFSWGLFSCWSQVVVPSLFLLIHLSAPVPAVLSVIPLSMENCHKMSQDSKKTDSILSDSLCQAYLALLPALQEAVLYVPPWAGCMSTSALHCCKCVMYCRNHSCVFCRYYLPALNGMAWFLPGYFVCKRHYYRIYSLISEFFSIIFGSHIHNSVFVNYSFHWGGQHR